MKKQIGKMVLATAVIMALTACGEDQKNNTVVSFDHRTSTSEEIALAGEQLVAPHSFHLADKIFDLALEKDPKNERAQFYKHLLKPFMTTQGVIGRMKAFAKQRGQSESLEKSIQETPTASLKDFLVNQGNKASITDEKTAQDALVEMRDAFIDASKWLKANAETELDLNMNPYLFKDEIKDREMDACALFNDGDVYEYSCYGEARKNILITKVNSADLRTIQHVYAGYALLLMSYTNYSFEGLEAFSHEIKDLNPEQKAAKFQKFAKLGTLRKDHAFGFFGQMGADLISSVKWAMKYQNSLCPTGAENKKNRKGYALESGLCIAPNNLAELNKSLAIAQAVLSGPFKSTVGEAPYQKEYTINYSVIWNSPIQDLKKTSMAASHNECGNATSFADKTLGGILPDGNADEFLNKSCN